MTTQATLFVQLWQDGEDVAQVTNEHLTAVMTGRREDDKTEWTCWVFNDRSAVITMEGTDSDGTRHRVVQIMYPGGDALAGEVKL
jgi:hypothetical protein